ncbi:ATPase [Halobacteriales archaeon SW_8_65_20]|nr:MAG: ATPase [Halobacteriales archaeon SW_8_65_20]
MSTERITVGEVSDGDAAGQSVELPIVDILTGRGFITGKSGSGKSNSASVIAEKLLDRGYSLICVDIDGEYYGLKEEYEILHVGADDECDLQVSVEHAEKLASLALEQGVPIILDVSSFLDERDARELLKEVAKQLFAKEKKQKQPFLMLVEEIHEYIPEGGGMGECGRMLVKVGKRGRKHGLGIVGISQRPADVKKDFITQCDWLLWHRLTWSNDTKVAGRILGSDYRERVEELADGECFMTSDFQETLRQVQMERKRTFDAGATPGLDDFERPELKSVSEDLMGELETITENEKQRESRVQELELELRDKEEELKRLRAELEEAKDLSAMAERFSRAMLEHASGRAFRDDITGRQSELHEHDGPDDSGGTVVTTGDDERRKRRTATENRTTDDGFEHLQSPDFGAGRMAEAVDGSDDETDETTPDDTDSTDRTETEATEPVGDVEPSFAGTSERSVVTELRETIDALDPITRGMLARYRESGSISPLDAHVAAGGDGDRTAAYRRNGQLRAADLVAHAGRGGYRARLRDEIQARHDGRLDEHALDEAVARVTELLPATETERSGEPTDGEPTQSSSDDSPTASAGASGTDTEILTGLSDPDATTSGSGDDGDTDGTDETVETEIL